jgi:hypothetical protein
MQETVDTIQARNAVLNGPSRKHFQPAMFETFWRLDKANAMETENRFSGGLGRQVIVHV